MATLSEERTEVLGERSGVAAGRAAVDRGLMFDDVLIHRPRRIGVRSLVVLVVAAVAAFGVWATGAAALGAAEDCFLISGSEYGGVTIVPGCGEVTDASAQAAALAPESSSASTVALSPATASSQLWLPMPRLVVELVDGLLG